ncbi:MAG TPA: hypothetical protein VHA10_24630, partial [Hypericibacter adhaerens]|uniref:hypothetical protein n=1 Tax=Hypericibacter adhaerens TaxID=2602016 RepID=UPI002CC6571F
RDARKACMELELLLQASGVATSAQDSRRRARDFSLVFNTHADAGTDRWKALAARLRLLLVGPRLGAKGAAAQATLRFAHHRSLLAFETDIAEAEGLN